MNSRRYKNPVTIYAVNLTRYSELEFRKGVARICKFVLFCAKLVSVGKGEGELWFVKIEHVRNSAGKSPTLTDIRSLVIRSFRICKFSTL
jgi:hypothetical protein